MTSAATQFRQRLRLGRRIASVSQHAWSGLRWVAYAIVPPMALPWLAALVWGRSELSIRVGGLALNLLGAALVASGIKSVRELFGHAGIVAKTRDWVRGFPAAFVALKSVSSTASVSVDALLSGEGTVTVKTPAVEPTLEERLAAVEGQLRLLEKTDRELRNTIDVVRTELRKSISSAESKLTAQIESLHTKVVTVTAGGLDVQIVGLVWVVVGQFYTTVPCELARLIGWSC